MRTWKSKVGTVVCIALWLVGGFAIGRVAREMPRDARQEAPEPSADGPRALSELVTRVEELEELTNAMPELTRRVVTRVEELEELTNAMPELTRRVTVLEHDRYSVQFFNVDDFMELVVNGRSVWSCPINEHCYLTPTDLERYWPPEPIELRWLHTIRGGLAVLVTKFAETEFFWPRTAAGLAGILTPPVPLFPHPGENYTLSR